MADEVGYPSAEALFAALGTQDAIARRGVLAWIAQNPADAIALGGHEGRDVVDVLIDLVPRELDYGLWEDLAITIGAFDAPRVSAFFLALLADAGTSQQASDAAGQLERRRRSGMRENLVAIIAAGGPPERIAATAELLAGETELPPRVAVIVAALEERTPAPPIDSPAVVEAWVEALGGAFASSARDRLEDQGPEALAALLTESDRLPEDDRAWLRGALVARGDDAISATRGIVRGGPEAARIEATKVLLDLGDDDWLRRELLEDR